MCHIYHFYNSCHSWGFMKTIRFSHCTRADRGLRCHLIHHWCYTTRSRATHHRWNAQHHKTGPQVRKSDLTLKGECRKCQDDWGLRQMFENDYPKFSWEKDEKENVHGSEGLGEEEQQEAEEDTLAAESTYDEIDFDPDCDCYRGRDYCKAELRRYGSGKWRNVGAYMARKMPLFRDLEDDGEDGRKGSVMAFR